MPSIISTLTADNVYSAYAPKNPNEKNARPNVVQKSVLIRGGANVAKQKTINDGLITPKGIATFVSDDDLSFLESHKEFQRHVKNGFLKVVRSSAPKAETVAKDLKPADTSAPYTDADYKPGGRGDVKASVEGETVQGQKAPIVGKKKDK